MTDQNFRARLQTEFPNIYPEDDHSRALGHPEGWDRVVWEFSEKLSKYVAETGADVQVLSTGEKYAQLQIWLGGEDSRRPPRPSKCAECQRELNLTTKYCPQCGTVVEYDGGYGEVVMGLVEAAQGQSDQTCQECGKPGMWHEVDHWEYVLCPDHFTVKEFGCESLYYQALVLLRDAPTGVAEGAEWRKRVTQFLEAADDHEKRWVPGHGLVED